jgi:hypothetical protein
MRSCRSVFVCFACPLLGRELRPWCSYTGDKACEGAVRKAGKGREKLPAEEALFEFEWVRHSVFPQLERFLH